MAGRREPPVASNQPAVVSAWEPLRRPVFRTLWIASIAANVGAWMQGVAAAWLMTSLSPSPTLVALADVVDRRKLLIVMQVWLSLALAVLTWVGAMTPALLLALTFALGLGWAVNLPIWQSIQPDLVPRSELAQAVTLGGINVNISRAVGPAVGGLIIAAAGAAAAFLVGVFVFWGWRGVPLDAELPERLPGAVRAGLRYVRNEPALRAVLIRASLFMVGGSAILALLPLVARRELGLGSGGLRYPARLFRRGGGGRGHAPAPFQAEGVAEPPRLGFIRRDGGDHRRRGVRREPRRGGGSPAGGRDGLAHHDGQPEHHGPDGAAGVGEGEWTRRLRAGLPGVHRRGERRLGLDRRALGSLHHAGARRRLARPCARGGLPVAAGGGRGIGPLAVAALAGAGGRYRGRAGGGPGPGHGRIPRVPGTLAGVREGHARVRTHPAPRWRCPLGAVPRPC